MDDIAEIIEAKRNAGASAFLHLGIDGKCTLWSGDPASTTNATVLRYWTLTHDECDRIIEADLVDSAV